MFHLVATKLFTYTYYIFSRYYILFPHGVLVGAIFFSRYHILLSRRVLVGAILFSRYHILLSRHVLVDTIFIDGTILCFPTVF